MKKILSLFVLVSVLSTFSCSSSDDDNDNGPANFIFTVDGTEYRIGNGVFYDSSESQTANLDTVEAYDFGNGHSGSVVFTPNGIGDSAVLNIFVAIDGTNYFWIEDESQSNIDVNDASRVEGTFSGRFRNVNATVFITVSNGSFQIDK